MELYTWPEDRVKVLIDKNELFENGLDPHDGFVSNQKAELFFAKILRTICNHFNWSTNIQIEAEIRESVQDAVFLIIDCLDEQGDKMPLKQSESQSVLFRFAREEDVEAFAKRAQHHGITGGSFIVFDPCYYLLFDPAVMDDGWSTFVMLLEEYGERSPLDPDYVRNNGIVVNNDTALQFIAARYE
ncbi:hypothetical protein D7Z54_17950 [Salibacterium salarium]|uniref:Adapter protein MecA 1/2 n=1 Tax=Salibacterium salarium TaxID=284579 RepID=A0A3R9P3K3_9BACI|nr:hypothetical protein [Salibacterium salarium]RSL32079.1 hypothetical protein D7Z54_17950 [Salibacterium salarium]